jgi:hypothetical protein
MDIPQFLRLVSTNQNAMESARKLYGDRLAPDFNPFDFIEPDEMRLSRVISWLLSPTGTHGQGGCFLRLFLGELEVEWPPEACERADVRTEFSVPEGRLDVFVRWGNRILAIENKPWAGAPTGQLRRYFSHLDSIRSDHHLVYLTIDGSEPSIVSIDEKERVKRISDRQLHLWGYRNEILTWLTKCKSECRADRVSAFIDEFARYIRSAFEGVKDRTMSDHLLDEVSGSAQNVSAAMQVILLADPLRKKLLSDLKQQLTNKLPTARLELNDNPWARFSGLKMVCSDQSPYEFCMEFQNMQYNGLFIGVSRKRGSPERGNEFSSLVREIVAATQNPDWLWGRNASPTDSFLPVALHWNQAAEPWIDIANGRLACQIVEAFTRVHSVLKECGVG